MELQKPIIFFDIEATGLYPEKDRIVTMAMLKLQPGGSIPSQCLNLKCNPGFLMSDEVVDIHGVTNEEVADLPTFAPNAERIYGFIQGCDLAGYNLLNFDVPLLWEELYRAGIQWNLDDVAMIDVGNIFKKKEQRSLEAAVLFYCDRELVGAHQADVDAQATFDVFVEQAKRYPDIGAMSVNELSDYSKLDKMPRLDLAGKLGIDADGDYVYRLHSKRGIKVKDEPSFAEWMLQKDFPLNTKMHLNRILDELYPKKFPDGVIVFAAIDEPPDLLPPNGPADDCPF